MGAICCAQENESNNKNHLGNPGVTDNDLDDYRDYSKDTEF